MFTGIIDHCGKIIEANERDNTLTLRIESQFDDLKEGESIAVDGICLTTIKPENGKFYCQISPETYALTTAPHLKEGSLVNLERALRLLDRVGGHFVLGHVDHTASIKTINAQNEFMEIHLEGFDEYSQTLAFKKGSIALNGVSLTINDINDTIFQFMLIPHTLAKTNLKKLKVGDKVNVEYDWLLKMIKQQV